MNIHKKVTANGEFENIISVVFEMAVRSKAKNGCSCWPNGPAAAVHGIRDAAYTKTMVICPYVKASKRMKRALGLIGVGKYLVRE